MKRPILVDAHGLLHAAHHALAGQFMETPDGAPCEAAFGALKSLFAALERMEHAGIAAGKLHLAMDGGKSARRLEVLQTYKTKPKKALPPADTFDLPAQRELFAGLAGRLGGWVYLAPGVEADDVIALLALAFYKAGAPAVIVSRDRDFHQLADIADIWKPGAHALRLFGRSGDAAEDRWRGARFLFYRLLCGDASDRIPGLGGVGPKRAEAFAKTVADKAAERGWALDSLSDWFRCLDWLRQAGWEPAGRKAGAAWRRLATADGSAALARNRALMDLRLAAAWPEVEQAALRARETPAGLSALAAELARLGWLPSFVGYLSLARKAAAFSKGP